MSERCNLESRVMTVVIVQGCREGVRVEAPDVSFPAGSLHPFGLCIVAVYLL
jgi:hypothetical protein